jgi:hypothetical protein
VADDTTRARRATGGAILAGLPSLESILARLYPLERTALNGYLGALAIAELSIVFGAIAFGVFLDAALLIGLLGVTLLTHPEPRATRLPIPVDAATRALPVLALLPLLRILSLTMPIEAVPSIYWHALIGAPLLVAVAAVTRLPDPVIPSLAAPGRMLPQCLMGLSGMLMGAAGFLAARPDSAVSSFQARDAIIGTLILMVFVGFAEELIFRGMLQQIAIGLLGESGLIWTSVLFAVMHIGSLSPIYLTLMGFTGYVFGWFARRTGSLWGVIIAHGLMISSMTFLWPVVLPG